MRNKHSFARAVLLALSVVALAAVAQTANQTESQTKGQSTHQTANQNTAEDETVDYHINAMRADLRADKADIIKEAMQLKPNEAQAFWPVYKEYEAALTKANDDLVSLVKTYASDYGSLSDAEAKDLTQKALDYQQRKLDIRKKYFPIFSKATSPLTAAKFYQVENRLELLFNLKLASELPALIYQPTQQATAPREH
jgi:hypothetical protein